MLTCLEGKVFFDEGKETHSDCNRGHALRHGHHGMFGYEFGIRKRKFGIADEFDVGSLW